MSKIKRGTEAEWREFGRAVFDTRNLLQAAAVKYQTLVPARLTEQYLRTVERIDRLRSRTEDEMFQRNGPQDTNVWYPAGDERKVDMPKKMHPVIERIIPADGWSAVYATGSPDKLGRHFYTEPLAVWALVLDGSTSLVVGLGGDDIHWQNRPWESEYHCGYVLTDAIKYNSQALNEEALEVLARMPLGKGGKPS